jgi:hypothetical protein
VRRDAQSKQSWFDRLTSLGVGTAAPLQPTRMDASFARRPALATAGGLAPAQSFQLRSLLGRRCVVVSVTSFDPVHDAPAWCVAAGALFKAVDEPDQPAPEWQEEATVLSTIPLAACPARVGLLVPAALADGIRARMHAGGATQCLVVALGAFSVIPAGLICRESHGLLSKSEGLGCLDPAAGLVVNADVITDAPAVLQQLGIEVADG